MKALLEAPYIFMKCSSGFSYILFTTIQPFAPIPVYYNTFLFYMVFILWCYQGVLECSVAFKIYFDAMLTIDILNTFTQALHIWYNNVPLGFV